MIQKIYYSDLFMDAKMRESIHTKNLLEKGHSDIQTTMNRYVHRDVSQIRLAGREFGEKVTEILTKTNTSKPLHYKAMVWTHNNIPEIRHKR